MGVVKILLKAIIAATALLLVSLPVATSPFSGTSPDPFIVTEVSAGGGLWNNDAGYYDLNAFGARTLRASPQINTGIKNLVLIIAGQSNVGSEAPSAYVPTNSSAVDNFNLY